MRDALPKLQSYNSMKTPAFLLSGFLALSVATPSRAAISFVFDYSDPSAAAWTSQAKAALDSAAGIVASYFPSYTRTITMSVTGSNINDSTLASAGSSYTSPTAGFGNLGVVGTKIQTGVDSNGATADGVVDANFFHPWSFTDTVSGSQFDFISTMAHEISHAMGFLSLISPSTGLSAFGPPFNTSYAPFDRYVVSGSGTPMINPVGFAPDASWAVHSVGGTGTVPATANTGLYFNGPETLAANGGNPVPLYSPNPWEAGSSGSHLDDFYYSGANAKVMNAATTTGLGERTFSSIELAMWRDLGYVTIPEPTTGLLLVLTGLLSCNRRRRN